MKFLFRTYSVDDDFPGVPDLPDIPDTPDVPDVPANDAPPAWAQAMASELQSLRSQMQDRQPRQPAPEDDDPYLASIMQRVETVLGSALGQYVGPIADQQAIAEISGGDPDAAAYISAYAKDLQPGMLREMAKHPQLGKLLRDAAKSQRKAPVAPVRTTRANETQPEDGSQEYDHVLIKHWGLKAVKELRGQ